METVDVLSLVAGLLGGFNELRLSYDLAEPSFPQSELDADRVARLQRAGANEFDQYAIGVRLIGLYGQHFELELAQARSNLDWFHWYHPVAAALPTIDSWAGSIVVEPLNISVLQRSPVGHLTKISAPPGREKRVGTLLLIAVTQQ
jgi:hypothetical protein